MRYLKIVSVVVFGLLQYAIAVPDDFPKNMVGFVRPNSHVGMNRDQQSGKYSLTILTEPQHSLLRDLRVLDVDAIKLKYAEVAAEFARMETKGELKRQTPRADGTRIGKTKVSVSSLAGILYKVIHVGEDYLLLEITDDSANRLVVNAAAITTIVWNSGLQYGVSNKVLRGNETESNDEPKSLR